MAKAAPKAAGKKPRSVSKSQLFASLSEASGVSKKDVAAVLEALGNEVKKALGNKGTGIIQIPGLVKITKKKVPARPAKKGVNVMGVIRDLPAKPASTKVAVRALKALKEMV